MRKSLVSLVIVAGMSLAGIASASELYATGGLRSIKGVHTEATAGVGYEGEVNNSGLRVGVQADQSVGNTAYHTLSGTVGYSGYNFTPFIRYGTVGGDIKGRETAFGVEYRTDGARQEGWSLVGEVGRVSLDDTKEAGRMVSVGARYRF